MCEVVPAILARAPAARARCIPPACGVIGIEPLSVIEPVAGSSRSGSLRAPRDPMASGRACPSTQPLPRGQPYAVLDAATVTADGARPRRTPPRNPRVRLPRLKAAEENSALLWTPSTGSHCAPRPITRELSRCPRPKPPLYPPTHAPSASHLSVIRREQENARIAVWRQDRRTFP